MKEGFFPRGSIKVEKAREKLLEEQRKREADLEKERARLKSEEGGRGWLDLKDEYRKLYEQVQRMSNEDYRNPAAIDERNVSRLGGLGKLLGHESLGIKIEVDAKIKKEKQKE